MGAAIPVATALAGALLAWGAGPLPPAGAIPRLDLKPYPAPAAGERRWVVQLPGIEDPNRIKQLLGKTARMTFRLTDETANTTANVAPPGVDFMTGEGRGGGTHIELAGDHIGDEARAVFAEERDLAFEAGDGSV